MEILSLICILETLTLIYGGVVIRNKIKNRFADLVVNTDDPEKDIYRIERANLVYVQSQEYVVLKVINESSRK